MAQLVDEGLEPRDAGERLAVLGHLRQELRLCVVVVEHGQPELDPWRRGRVDVGRGRQRHRKEQRRGEDQRQGAGGLRYSDPRARVMRRPPVQAALRHARQDSDGAASAPGHSGPRSSADHHAKGSSLPRGVNRRTVPSHCARVGLRRRPACAAGSASCDSESGRRGAVLHGTPPSGRPARWLP